MSEIYIDSFIVNSNIENNRILKKMEIIFENSNCINNILHSLNEYLDFNYSIELNRVINLEQYSNSIKINYIAKIPKINSNTFNTLSSNIYENSFYLNDIDEESNYIEESYLSFEETHLLNSIDENNRNTIFDNYLRNDLYYQDNMILLSNRYTNNYYNRIYDINEYSIRNLLTYNQNNYSNMLNSNIERRLSLIDNYYTSTNLTGLYTTNILNQMYLNSLSLDIENDLDDEIDELSLSKEIPKDFICPISLCIMRNPVISIYGHSYEKSKIVKWVKKNYKCPLTSKPLYVFQLIPNISLKNIINNYLETKNEV